MNYKNIEIGSLIKDKVRENDIDLSRICKFFGLSILEIEQMYECKSLDSEILLRWSKLLEYDFFRIYTQHLILYAPANMQTDSKPINTVKSRLPQFRKNIYTKEVIEFIIEVIEKGEKTRLQVIQDYNIPKTTLYKWIAKKSKKLN